MNYQPILQNFFNKFVQQKIKGMIAKQDTRRSVSAWIGMRV